jgi:hypothetical protein
MIQTRSTTIRFNAPFTLPGLDREYPAGSYRVDIDEEQLDVSFPASRRVGTTIILVSGGVTQAWSTDARELEAALAKDSANPLHTSTKT